MRFDFKDQNNPVYPVILSNCATLRTENLLKKPKNIILNAIHMIRLRMFSFLCSL